MDAKTASSVKARLQFDLYATRELYEDPIWPAYLERQKATLQSLVFQMGGGKIIGEIEYRVQEHVYYASDDVRVRFLVYAPRLFMPGCQCHPAYCPQCGNDREEAT